MTGPGSVCVTEQINAFAPLNEASLTLGASRSAAFDIYFNNMHVSPFPLRFLGFFLLLGWKKILWTTTRTGTLRFNLAVCLVDAPKCSGRQCCRQAGREFGRDSATWLFTNTAWLGQTQSGVAEGVQKLVPSSSRLLSISTYQPRVRKGVLGTIC